MWILLASCASPPTTASTPAPVPVPVPAPAPAGSTGSTGSTAETGAQTADTAELLPPLLAGSCDVDLTSALALPMRVLFESSTSYYFTLPRELPFAEVFTDDQELTDWAQGHGIPLEPADFATEIVIAGGYYDANTCDLQLGSPLAWEVGGVPHVQIQVEDTSYGCAWQCAHSETALVVVAVPRGSAATVCVSVGGGCGQAPF